MLSQLFVAEDSIILLFYSIDVSVEVEIERNKMQVIAQEDILTNRVIAFAVEADTFEDEQFLSRLVPLLMEGFKKMTVEDDKGDIHVFEEL